MKTETATVPGSNPTTTVPTTGSAERATATASPPGRKVLLVLMAVLVAVAVVQLSATADQRTYSFSTDPTVAVVEVTGSGGMARGKSSHTLFGDGRLVHRPRHPSEPSREARLTYTEMDEIVRAIVDGGIMDWDRADIARRLREAGATTDWTDVGAWTLSVNLDRYRNGGAEISPARKKITVSWLPALIKRSAPDAVIPEVEAIAFVRARIRELLVDGEE